MISQIVVFLRRTQSSPPVVFTCGERIKNIDKPSWSILQLFCFCL